MFSNLVQSCSTRSEFTQPSPNKPVLPTSPLCRGAPCSHQRTWAENVRAKPDQSIGPPSLNRSSGPSPPCPELRAGNSGYLARFFARCGIPPPPPEILSFQQLIPFFNTPTPCTPSPDLLLSQRSLSQPRQPERHLARFTEM